LVLGRAVKRLSRNKLGRTAEWNFKQRGEHGEKCKAENHMPYMGNSKHFRVANE
jgi:hypothetical protein